MFMFPERAPLGYQVRDVSPVYLSDPVFLRGSLAATHKYIGKHPKPLPRRITDPVAPPEEIQGRALERIVERDEYQHLPDPQEVPGSLRRFLPKKPEAVAGCSCWTLVNGNATRGEEQQQREEETWQKLSWELPRSTDERYQQLRDLSAPFLHDLNTWYSTRKPFKVGVTARTSGKRVSLERSFSHL